MSGLIELEYSGWPRVQERYRAITSMQGGTEVFSDGGTWTIAGGTIENASGSGICFDNGTLNISEVTIRNCGGPGLACGNSTVNAAELTIQDNGDCGARLVNCQGTLSDSVISGHTHSSDFWRLRLASCPMDIRS